MNKKITKEELEVFLRKHKLWLKGDSDGERANLYGADLYGANLYGANLYGADLYGANLCEADLRGANLYEADLYRANLYGADLYGANLYGADLYGADLRGANLRGANLRGADLYGANLYGANLYGADLYGADLRCPITCPEEGSFIGFKKARYLSGDTYRPCIVKLQIPEDAKRSSATSRKCRCSKATVISITNIDGSDIGVKDAVSRYDDKFIYTVGETVSVTDFCEDRWNECAPGIHFFITRQEAVEY